MKNVPPFDQLVRYRTGDGCRWHVLSRWQSALLSSEGLPLAQWLVDGRAKLIKDRAGRAVYYVRLNSHGIYVKHQRPGGLSRAIANLVRGTAARREWNHANEARGRGVETGQPIAFGEKYSHGLFRESYLITEAIEDVQPLGQLAFDRQQTLAPAEYQQVQRILLDRLAQFVATMHQAGLQHHDLHAGNILVAASKLDDPSRPSIYLVDLPKVRFSGPLDWNASRASLIVLHAEWFDRLTVMQRWRFLQTYLKHRPELRHPVRDAMVDQLDRGARAYSHRIDRGRDRRALRTNRDYFAMSQSGRRLHAVCDLPESFLNTWSRCPEALIQKALDRPVKISHTTLMGCVELPMGDGAIHIAIKRCRPRNAWKSLCDRFRRSRGLRGWYNGHALLSRRIATARPLAVCDTARIDRPSHRFPWLRWFARRESYLAVEWIEGATNLHLWAWQLADRSLDERLRLATQCADSLGRLLGRMHARHVSHRDLKGSNLLIGIDPEENKRVWLVDTDSVRIHRRLSSRRRAIDLSRLATSVEAHGWVTRSIRYRFLRAYAEQFPHGAVDVKYFWRSVARRAARQIARKKRRGKPLL